jgi:hypothetical protein
MLDWCDSMDIPWRDKLELIPLVGPLTHEKIVRGIDILLLNNYRFGDPSERVTLYKSTRVVNTCGH